MMKKLLLSMVLAGFLAAATTHADPYNRQWHQAHWGEGHWVHDRHGGRLGWWWVIGSDWHYYVHPVAQPQMVIIQQPAPAPMFVQQAPAPQVVVQQAPPAPAPIAMAPAPTAVTPTMYYCKATGTYYPETMTCPNGWTPVTAGAPPAP